MIHFPPESGGCDVRTTAEQGLFHIPVDTMHAIMVPTGNVDNGFLSGTVTGNLNTQEDVLIPGISVLYDPTLYFYCSGCSARHKQP